MQDHVSALARQHPKVLWMVVLRVLVAWTISLGSSLQNLGDGFYQYNWATPKSYANSCKTLQLDLSEGLYRTAAFQFTK